MVRVLLVTWAVVIVGAVTFDRAYTAVRADAGRCPAVAGAATTHAVMGGWAQSDTCAYFAADGSRLESQDAGPRRRSIPDVYWSWRWYFLLPAAAVVLATGGLRSGRWGSWGAGRSNGGRAGSATS